MPRKKTEKKFKYTVRKNGVLYVKYPVKGLKNPVWRVCREETQKAVDEIIEELNNDRAAALAETEIPTTCEGYFNFWLESVKNRISARTLQGYENVIRRYLAPEIGDLPISEIKPKHLERLYRKMSASGLQPVTVRKTHMVAGNAFREAQKHEVISSNPAQFAKPPKVTGTLKIKTLSPDEARKFIEVCQKHSHGIIFEFALETGLRPQEYLALRWSDLDLEKPEVSVTRALVYDRKGGGFYFKEPKTNRSRRSVPVSPKMAEKLKIHRENQKDYLLEVADRLTRHCKPSREYRAAYNKKVLKNHEELDLVFASQDGTPFKDINLGKRYFKQIAKAAGLSSDLTLYSLRHTCATLLLSANVNPKIVSERLGHSSVAITLDTYSHVLPNMQQDATEKITSILYS